MPNYTETWFQNRDNRIIYNKARYIQLTIEKLLRAIKGDELFAPQNINTMVSNILQDALYLEQSALETYENLDETTKDTIQQFYNQNIKLHGEDAVDNFYKKQEEIQENIRKKVNDKLNAEELTEDIRDYIEDATENLEDK